MKLKLVTAVKDAEDDATCAIFECEDSAVIVVRALGRDAPEDLRSIKLRDLGSSSLEETMSYWNAGEPSRPSDLSVEQLELYARSFLLSITGIEL